LVQEILDVIGVEREAYLQAFFAHNKKVNRGEVTWDELWELVLGELGHGDKAKKIAALTEAANADNINQDILRLVDTLRAAGYKVGLLSNNTREKGAHLRRTGLANHFDVFHISAETGHVKPEPAAFKHFAQALGVDPHELIFIDDSEKSLSTATECGYMPIHFTDYQQLVTELHRLGVEV
jgi:putative hydrolase of the HAD superfamily